MRSGNIITQQTGYKAFIPKPLPPDPPIQMEGEIQHLLTNANIAIGKMDTIGYLAPNLDHIIAMYVQEDHKQRLIAQRLSTVHAIALLDYLVEKPHLTIKEVANHLKISYQGAKVLVDHFLLARILKEITGKKRDKRYTYWEYIALLSEGT